MKNKKTRREFLGTAAGAAGASALSRSAGENAQQEQATQVEFLPEDEWRERMTPPEDGKRYGWFIDTRRCFGCHGCEVSCKSENDVPLGNFIRQTFYKDVGEYPSVARVFLPMSCQHCEDAPCIKACPSAAIAKGAGGSVVVDYTKCSGEGACVDACPYGAIYVDSVHNQAVKCHNCYHRLENDMEPACANTCPADAIYFGDLNDSDSKVSRALQNATDGQLPLVQLRTDRETRPRMWFSGPAPAELESRVPAEGDSYSPEAYDIYNWKERTSP